MKRKFREKNKGEKNLGGVWKGNKKLAPCRGGNIVPLTTTTQKEKKLRGKGDDHFTTQRIFLWIVKLNCWDSFFREVGRLKSRDSTQNNRDFETGYCSLPCYHIGS